MWSECNLKNSETNNGLSSKTLMATNGVDFETGTGLIPDRVMMISLTKTCATITIR